MGLEDVADSRVGDVVANIGQATLDPVKAPTWVFFGQSQYEVHDDLSHTWPTWFLFLAAIAVIPLLGDQLSMPTQQRVRSDDGGQFHQGLSPQSFGFDGQYTALVVSEEDPLFALRFQQGLDLRLLKVIDLLLVMIDQGSQDRDEELPWLQNKSHGRAKEVKGRERHQYRFYPHTHSVTGQPNPLVAPPQFQMPCGDEVNVSCLGKVYRCAGPSAPAEIRVCRGHVNARISES